MACYRTTDRQPAAVEVNAGDAATDSERGEKTNTPRHGHSGVIGDSGSKMETRTSYAAAYIPPKSPGVRLYGTRRGHMAKRIAQEFSEKIQREQKEHVPKIEFCSTTQRDFSVQGFVPEARTVALNRDYKTDQAVTFWSENCQMIQGVTSVQNPREPFKKWSMFSTPISQRLDEIHPQYGN